MFANPLDCAVLSDWTVRAQGWLQMTPLGGSIGTSVHLHVRGCPSISKNHFECGRSARKTERKKEKSLSDILFFDKYERFFLGEPVSLESVAFG